MALNRKVFSSSPVYSPITCTIAVEAPVPVRGVTSSAGAASPTPAQGEGSCTELWKLGGMPPSRLTSGTRRPSEPDCWLVSTSW